MLNPIIPQELLTQKLLEYLKEDIPSFDFGAIAVGQDVKEAKLLCKAECHVSGLFIVEHLFNNILNCQIELYYTDGDYINPNQPSESDLKRGSSKGRIVVATVNGNACNILRGERVALNLIARTSGITTLARNIMAGIQQKNINWKGKIAGTRKTTPGFRLFEKYALIAAGVDCHRMDLSSMTMLKDNHIWSCGSIQKAVEKAKSVGGFSLKIEVECRSFEEAVEAINAGADVVMLDNFEPDSAKKTAQKLKNIQKNIIIEVSGGITSDTVVNFIDNSIDVISMGSLTQGVPHIDFSLKIKK